MDSTSTHTQQELLDKLEALFLEEGFANFTVGELASRLSCSRRALYQLAPSKTELIARVVEANLDKRFRQSESALNQLEAPVDRLVRFLNGIAQRNDNTPEHYRRDMMENSTTNALRIAHMERMLKLLEAIIRDGISKGVFRQKNPELVTAFAMALMRTTADPELAARLNSDYPALFEQGVEFLLQGVLAR